jgi:valyl-tRNA synthetase
VLLRLFAPFLPFVTEEVWSWWQEGSVHRAAWPLASGEAGDPLVLATAAAVLGDIRKAKSAAKVSMRAEAARVVVRGPSYAADAMRVAEGDLRAAGNIADFSFVLVPVGELATRVTLADPVTS